MNHPVIVYKFELRAKRRFVPFPRGRNQFHYFHHQERARYVLTWRPELVQNIFDPCSNSHPQLLKTFKMSRLESSNASCRVAVAVPR
ncbi:hypothetical protein LSTR_LSTR012110, partial [Laodelphax striatellus]